MGEGFIKDIIFQLSLEGAGETCQADETKSIPSEVGKQEHERE